MFTLKNKLFLKEGLLLFFGCVIYAISVEWFLSPLKISPGGITGIAVVLNFLTDISTGIYMMLLNIPLLIIGYVKFGGTFILKTTVAVGVSSVMVDVVKSVYVPLFSDKLLCAVFGGLLMGFALGLVMLAGATTGGIDIAVKLLNRRYKISIGRAYFIVDGVVLILVAVIYNDFQSALYSVVAVFLSSRAVDFLLCSTSDSKAIFIISEFEEAIKLAINNETDRGVTVLPAFGGYTGRKNNILLCVARNNEINKVRSIILHFDSEAFFFIVNAGDVIGKGFK